MLSTFYKKLVYECEWKLQRLFADARCMFCHGGLITNGYLCSQCLAELPWSTDISHLTKFMSHVGYVWRYEYPIDSAIIRFKFMSDLCIGRCLAVAFVESLLAWLQDKPTPDLIIPVPLHPKRLRQRGFNQATYLTRALPFGVYEVNEQLCVRHRHTEAQSGLSKYRRMRNVRGAFRLNSQKNANKINNRSVLLIDDVLTTGNTLNALAECLLAGGASEVMAFTLARAV